MYPSVEAAACLSSGAKRAAAGYWLTMSHENVEIVCRLYEALDRRDLAAVDRLCHDHVRIHTRVGEVTGRVYRYGEVEAYFAAVDEVWDDVRQTALDVEPLEHDQVVLTVRYQARAKASDVEADQFLGVLVRLTNGKVERIDAYPSRQAALDAAASHQ